MPPNNNCSFKLVKNDNDHNQHHFRSLKNEASAVKTLSIDKCKEKRLQSIDITAKE